MLWLIPIGIVGAAAAIYGYFSDKEREARQRWEHDRIRVEQTVEEHRANIERHIGAAQASYDFNLLRDLHHSSFRVADEAYRLKRDADRSIAVMKRMIDDAKKRRSEFHEELRPLRDREQRETILQEVRLLNELLDRVFPDFQVVTKQKRAFALELSRLNDQTRMLKEAIANRCGPRGREWFERLEARNRIRREQV